MLKQGKFIFGVLFSLFAAAVLGVNAHGADTAQEGRVVASVNGVEIFRGDVDAVMSGYLPKTSFHSTVDPEKIKAAEKKALDELIDQELFFQQAKANEIEVSADEIEDRLKGIKKRYPSEKDFENALVRTGVDISVLKKWIEKDILINKYLLAETEAVVSDSDADSYYERNKEKFMEPEKVRASYIHIRFRPEEADFRAKAKAKAEEALSRLKAGEDFSAVAGKYSDHDSKVKGGDLGYFHRGTLEPLIEKAVQELEEGETSGLIENIMGFHIIRIEDIAPARQVPFDEIKDKLKAELTESRRKEKKQELIKRLRQDADIQYYLNLDQ